MGVGMRRRGRAQGAGGRGQGARGEGQGGGKRAACGVRRAAPFSEGLVRTHLLDGGERVVAQDGEEHALVRRESGLLRRAKAAAEQLVHLGVEGGKAGGR